MSDKNQVDPTRIFLLNHKPVGEGVVVYWMSRDQRVHDNWALLFSQQLAREKNAHVVVAFCLVPDFLEATLRQYDFLLQGLQQTEAELKKFQIPFTLLPGNPEEEIVRFAKKIKAGAVVTDFDPLKIKMQWRKKAAASLPCALFEVDTHNIVPVRAASPKQEFGAYTLRPKIHKLLSHYLSEFPSLKKQARPSLHVSAVNWKGAYKSLKINLEVKPVDWCKPGEKAGHAALKKFLTSSFSKYDQDRNDPTKDAQSNLSPYLHFGQLSAQRVALEVKKSHPGSKNADAFLEELIVRRELSDNFCFYNPHYDSSQGFPQWAQKTLNQHAKDAREFVYTKNEFEHGRTHDPLWNAAQMQMVQTGKMHGYMRMYWAKKILEWTRSPEEAMRVAIYLNDKYELDGRDPNGYTGIAWSIGGVHDRAWFERPIFGKIRYMSFGGAKSKFDVKSYIAKYMDTNQNNKLF